MTLEKFSELMAGARIQQCYDNTTGVAPILITGLSLEQFFIIANLANDKLRADWPLDFQI